MGWKTSQKRKVHQRQINHYVRMMNQNLKNDPLWQGRFEVRQVGPTSFFHYDDHSGAALIVTLQIIDKVTGDYVNATKSVNEWCWYNGTDIWWFVNNTIIKWREEYNF